MKQDIISISKPLIVLSIAAGIFYSTWPLGHWLNLEVSKNSLASGLEAVGQPYNWIFIGGDILAGLLVIIVCLLLLKKGMSLESKKLTDTALIFTILFGVGTIVDALLPLKCVQGVESCPSFTTDHLLLAHGIFSISASVFLFFGLLILWTMEKRNIILNTFLAGYILFGAISLLQAILPGKNGNWSQDYYITLCSLWIAILPYVFNKNGTNS